MIHVRARLCLNVYLKHMMYVIDSYKIIEDWGVGCYLDLVMMYCDQISYENKKY